jgi:hypothetical protein
MRTIKFRAWDSRKEKMFFWENTYQASEFWDDVQYPDTLPVMQYTGINDKNGVEIYEGDIVGYDYNSTPIVHYIDEVSFNQEWCCWGFGIFSLEPTIRKTIEVIGNIYENDIKKIKL